MGNVRDIRSVARPIDLGKRKENLDKRKKEIIETHENLKKRVHNLLKKK